MTPFAEALTDAMAARGFDMTALREARERLGLTLREAAPRLGIDFTYLSKVENGHERPSDALLLRMCDLYGLEPDAVVLARAVAEVPEAVRVAMIDSVCAETLTAARLAEALKVAFHDQRYFGTFETRAEAILAALATPPVSPVTASRTTAE